MAFSPERSTEAAEPIELRLAAVRQLFNSLDPTPFPERELDDAVDRFIVEWAEELPAGAALALVVHLPGGERAAAERLDLAAAVTAHFTYRADAERRRLRRLFREGRISLAIGVAFLTLCIVGARVVAPALSGPFDAVLAEGLIIIGWVANWRPAEIFLYEWWPIRARLKLLERLAGAPVSVRFDAPPERPQPGPSVAMK